MASAAVRSKAVILLLFSPCLLLSPLFVGFVLGPCFAMQFSVFFLILGKRELIALLSLSFRCHVAVFVF